MKKFPMVTLVLAAALTALAALSLGPPTNADEWDKKTIVTFDQAVEIPGQVLPAGTYVFKLFRSSSNRNIVQIWTEHELQLLSTLITVGDSYPNPSGEAYFVLDMTGTDEGYPPVVASWFFGGSDEGRDFIYKGYSTTRVATDQYNNQYNNQNNNTYPNDTAPPQQNDNVPPPQQ